LTKVKPDAPASAGDAIAATTANIASLFIARQHKPKRANGKLKSDVRRR
jgi:hypothetical protein